MRSKRADQPGRLQDDAHAGGYRCAHPAALYGEAHDVIIRPGPRMAPGPGTLEEHL